MRKWRYGSRRPAEGPFGWASGSGGVDPGGSAASFFILCGLGALLTLLALGWWQRWPVHSVAMEGAELLDTAGLLALLPEARTGISLKEWHLALLRHPLIEGASVYWERPGGVRVVIRERTLLARVAGPQRVGLDEAGHLWQLPPGVRLPECVLSLEGVGPAAEYAFAAAYLLRQLPRDTVAALSWKRGEGWIVRLRNGSLLLLGDTSAVATKWQQWCSLRTAAPVVADLRWRGLVVVRPSVSQGTEL